MIKNQTFKMPDVAFGVNLPKHHPYNKLNKKKKYNEGLPVQKDKVIFIGSHKVDFTQQEIETSKTIV